MSLHYLIFCAEYDFDVAATDFTLDILAGLFFAPPIPISLYNDGINETTEGFVLYLSIDEDGLEDERDRGQVSLERSVYLVRVFPLRKFSVTVAKWKVCVWV